MSRTNTWEGTGTRLVCPSMIWRFFAVEWMQGPAGCGQSEESQRTSFGEHQHRPALLSNADWLY
jgi:hypothetical protein